MSMLDDMADALFGGERLEVTASAASSQTYTITGRATSHSSGGMVWVELSDDVTQDDAQSDSDAEHGTSVEMSTTVNVLSGDEVIITVYGGVISSMVVTGVVGRGDEQDDKISDAQRAAQAAWDWADESHDAAVAAAESATEAQASADDAAADAASASASAQQAIADAATASASASSAAQAAQAAQQTADAAQQSADSAASAAGQAQTSANAAQASATSANANAIAALNSLSTVEDVVDTLTWITEHGTMAKTTDTAVDPTKVYFVRDNSGSYVVGSYSYSIVQEPVTSGLSDYYELNIDKSVQNYISTHLSLTNEGLWLTPTATNAYRVLVATGSGTTYTTAGTYIIDGSGRTIAQFTGTGISFAQDKSFYIGDNSAYIFFDGNGHITIGGTGVTIGGNLTLQDLIDKYDATITSDDISVSKTGGTATITVGGDSVTISDGAAGAQGPKGDTGDQGPQGPAGHSPTITTTKNSDGSVTIYVDGTATSTVDAGEDGQTPTVTTTKNSDGSVTIYVNGTASNTVEAGADGTSYYTYVRYSANASGSGMVTTPTSATKYIGVYTGTSSSVPAYTSFKWSKYVGEDGSDADPLTVTSHAVDYQLSTSGTTAPTGTWSTTPLAPTTTQYLWTRTTLGFSDGTESVSYSVGGKAGTNGQNGTNGTNGTDGGRWYAGTGITGTSTTATTFSGSGVSSAVVGDMYLNTSTYNTYRCTVAGAASDAKWVYTANIKGQTGAQGPQGETGSQGPQGPQGETGSAGTNGVSITGVEHQYYLSTSSTSQTGGSWKVAPDTYVDGRYYWERWKITFSNSTTTYTTATLAEEVKSVWTAIESSNEQIALKANSSDVYTKTAVDGKITQEVTDRNAAITAKANEITSSVSETYATKTTVNGKADASDVTALAGRVTTAESNITQNANNIALKVSKDGVISSINQSAESVTINAGKINLVGAVTIGDLASATQDAVLNSNLQVGGRNLLIGTSSDWSDWVTPTPDTNNVSTYFYMTENGKALDWASSGTNVTISFDIEFSGVIGTNGSQFSIRAREAFKTVQNAVINDENTADWAVVAMNLSSPPADGIYHYSETHQYTSSHTSQYAVLLNIRSDYWASGKYRIKNVKYEYGNTATDWTPAPEDVAHKSDVAWTGTCDTAAGTAAKEVVCDGFTASELTMGATICVRFNAANTSSAALTLNVNGTGAKPISVATGATSATNQLLWASGATIRFMYNASLGQWRVADTTPTYYSTCSIAEGVAAKTAGCAGCVIFKGVAIHIVMTAANTNTSATLNVNSTGAKAIYYGNTTTRPTTANEYGWKAGATASFVFDGAYWRYADASAMYQSADAAKTATSYITQVDQNGITIHPSGGTSNRVEIDADGMEVYKGDVSVASYGDTARIGKVAGPRVEVDDDSVSVYAGTDGSVKAVDIRVQQIIGSTNAGVIETDVVETQYLNTPHLWTDDVAINVGNSSYSHAIQGINFGFATGTTNSNGITTFNPDLGVKPTAVLVSAGKSSSETEAVAKIAVPMVWSIDSATQVQVRWQRSDTNAWLTSNAVGWYWLALV